MSIIKLLVVDVQVSCWLSLRSCKCIGLTKAVSAYKILLYSYIITFGISQVKQNLVDSLIRLSECW